MDHNELAFTPAWRLAELIAKKQLSPVELVDIFLYRIDRLNPKIHAYLTITHDIARQQAKSAEKLLFSENNLPPLHGVPMSIKDMANTKGIRTTYGSLVYKDNVPSENDIDVDRLFKAGGIILGKTNTPEFGKSALTVNRLGESCRSPWDIERHSAGSSGGAAASVAAGLGPLAQGGDGGGSIRMPASFCGVFGLKPTLGRIPMSRVNNVFSLHAVHGPITRSVRDAALMMNVMAGYDESDIISIKDPPPDYLQAMDGNVSGVKIAWSPDLGYATVSSEVIEITEKAAKRFLEFGCQVEEATPPIKEISAIHRIIADMPFYATRGDLLQKQPDELTDYVKDFLKKGETVKGSEYHLALCEREHRRKIMADFHRRYDLLLTPTMCLPAVKVGERFDNIEGKPINLFNLAGTFTSQFNVTGQPAATIPCGFTKDGLPVGLQIIGRWCDEMTILRASAAYEMAYPWSNSIPDIARLD